MPTVKQYRDDPTKQNKELLKNPSVQAMLKTIRYAEGTAGDRGYNTRVGYSEFDDLSKKPGKKVFIPSINDFSSAEGAYQFLNSTWDGVSKKLGLKDFSPESQDLAAIELIKNRGALDDVLSNNLDGALTKLSGEWASLPTNSGKSAYKNQNSRKAEDLSKVFFSSLENSKQNEDAVTTTAVNQLQIPIISGNFAGVSEAQTDKQPIKEAEEVKQKTNEYNFLKDYQEQYVQQQNEQPIQIPTIDVEQTVNDVSQFVDNPVAQQGRRPFKLQDERNLVQIDNTSTQKPNIEIDQKQLAFIAQYAKKNNIPIKEASERLYNENKYKQNNQVRAYTPQTTKSKVWEVATHPMTAAGYVVRSEDLPDNFSKGGINQHEQAVNIINPFFYADQAGQAVKNTSDGNFTEVGVNALNLLPLASEYGVMSRVFGKSSQLAPTIELEKAQNFVGKYNTNSRLLNPENIIIESPKYNQFSNKVLNVKVANLIDEQAEPYISKRVLNDSREQQIFESSFQPEQQRKLLEQRTKYYDSDGNIIPAPDNIYNPHTEDEYIKSFNAKRNRLQQGGTSEQKDIQWLQDWYANRVIPNKEVNSEYQKIKGEYEGASYAIPSPKHTGYIPTPKDWKGGRLEGMESADGSITLVFPPLETTYLHEATHHVDRRLGDLPMERIHKSIVDQNVAPIEGINTSYIKDNYKYYTVPTEVHARVQELRKKAGFKPNQEVKEEDLNKFLETYKGDVNGIQDLLNMTDTPHLIEILNTMADNSKPSSKGYAQQGSKRLNPNKFIINYINSPKYKERLIEQGYKNPQEVIDKRNSMVEVTKTINQDGKPNIIKQLVLKAQGIPYTRQGSLYDPSTSTIIMDNKTDTEQKSSRGVGYNGVKAHELAHAELNGYPLNKKDSDELFNRQKAYEIDEDFRVQDRDAFNRDKVPHDFKPDENKADLNSLRYLLKETNIYDAGKKEFKKEHLDKLKSNFIKDRLLKNYSEEDLIWLMNHIADNSNIRESNYAQQGVIKDQEGQRRFPNQVTEIRGNKMATDGYGNIPLYVIPDKGEPKIVMPNTGEHTFKGATKFTEYPITKEEQMFLEEYLKYKK